MLYFYVSLGYSVVNLILALIVLAKSRRNVLGQFYAFCVFALLALGATAYLLAHPFPGAPVGILSIVSAFLYSLFPFFFLHFMLIFVRRYEILKSPSIIIANYFAGMFSYAMVLLKLIPIPFSAGSGIDLTGYIYYLIWMSILFSIGVALLYSLIGGFTERGMKSNFMFVAFVVLMLLLPTPFTLSVFSIVSENSFMWYFLTSTAALTVVVYIVFRHRITMNTPYQAMKSALAAMNDILIKTNMDYEIEMAQGAVLALLGYTEDELRGRSLTGFLKDTDPLIRYRQSVLEDRGKEGFFEAEVICKNGSLLPMDFSFTPIYVNEEITGIVGVGRNIAERRRAERLKECAYKIAQAAETAQGLDELFGSVHGIIKTVMPAENFYIALYDRRDDMISFPYFVDEVDEVEQPRKARRGLTEYVLRSGRSLFCDAAMFHQLSRAGDVELVGAQSPIWLGVPLMIEKRTIGVMVVQHYTDPAAYTPQDLEMLEYVSTQVAQSIERKRAEEALRVSEEKYRRFFEEDLTGDITCLPDGSVRECNPAFARIFGFASVEEALRANLRSLYPHPKDFDVVMKRVRERGKLEYYEEELRRVDGQPVHVVENIIGSVDAGGELSEVKIYVFDNTERRQLEEQLLQAQKMENLGTLAGGIAHDFNNILTIMSVHASILRKAALPPETHTNVEAVSKAIGRGAGLVSQLLTFARRTDVLMESVNINYSIQELARMMEATFPKTTTVKLDLAENLPTLAADPNQVNQALLNLCVNARDAMPGGGTLTISTDLVDGQEVAMQFAQAQDEQYVRVSVADTGTGMDEATRRRLFEPFFTTKEKGKGTGLGLAVVYGVMKSHHGFIDVETAPGVGTKFMLYFHAPPLGVESARAGQREQEDAPGGSETILLVEDENLVLETIKSILEEKGYTVLTASDGEEAVSVYRRSHETIDLVVTDMGLPKMSGWDAYQKMRTLNPAIRAIIASGFLEPGVRSIITGNKSVLFIQKPYVPEQLLRKLRETLDDHKAR